MKLKYRKAWRFYQTIVAAPARSVPYTSFRNCAFCHTASARRLSRSQSTALPFHCGAGYTPNIRYRGPNCRAAAMVGGRLMVRTENLVGSSNQRTAVPKSAAR